MAVKALYRRSKNLISRIVDRFRYHRECPICGWRGTQFARGGGPNKMRFDCLCPKCRAVERHRLAYLVVESLDDLDFSKTLHVAPEKQIEDYLRQKSTDYLSIDLYRSAMRKMDVTALDLEDSSRSLIWVSHVLEHVEDDAKAISEFYRVLSRPGAAIVQVPIWRNTTYEDSSISSPAARNRAFYQTDHVRLYGLDIVERFEAQGFVSTIHRAQDFGPDLLLKHGLSFASTDEVFVFRKQIG